MHVITKKIPLPNTANTTFSCFRSMINTNTRALTALRLTASSWLVSPPLVFLQLKALIHLMGIRPSGQLCVWTCSNSNCSLFPSWSLLRDWTYCTPAPVCPSELTPLKCKRGFCFYLLSNYCICKWKLTSKWITLGEKEKWATVSKCL